MLILSESYALSSLSYPIIYSNLKVSSSTILLYIFNFLTKSHIITQTANINMNPNTDNPAIIGGHSFFPILFKSTVFYLNDRGFY